MSRKNIEKSFSEYTDADFELESVNFYESFLASEESQAVEETQKEKVATKKDKRVVIDKAEYQFGPHKATFKPLTKTRFDMFKCMHQSCGATLAMIMAMKAFYTFR